jgi:nucleotide-binding universal stress UspA family protein
VVAYVEPYRGGDTDAERTLEDACRAFGLAPTDLRSLSGDPMEELPKALRSGGADLLVMAKPASTAGRHARQPLVERLLGLGDCDVLLVPEDAVPAVASVSLAPFATDALHSQR